MKSFSSRFSLHSKQGLERSLRLLRAAASCCCCVLLLLILGVAALCGVR